MAQVPIDVRLSAYGLAAADVKLTDLTLADGEQQVLDAQNPLVSGHVRTLTPKGIADVKKWLAGPQAAAPAAAKAVAAPAAAKAAAAPAVAKAVAAPLIAGNQVVDYHAVADIVTPLPAVLTPNMTTALYAAANQYLFTTKAVEPQVVANLDTWIVRIVPQIPIFFFQDIVVNAGAKLTLAKANSVLFARYITVEKTGQIVGTATVIKIDCAGFTGH
jgi:hypothetical protein